MSPAIIFALDFCETEPTELSRIKGGSNCSSSCAKGYGLNKNGSNYVIGGRGWGAVAGGVAGA